MVKVYYAKTTCLEDEVFRAKQMDLVCRQRRDKILRCKSSQDKARSLAVGLLLRYALEQEGYIYGQVDVSVAEYGSLELQNCPNLHINLSHSGEYAVCVIADQKVGIDIERINRFEGEKNKERNRRIAQKYFVKEELISLENLSDKKFNEQFTLIWTRKESFSKAKGLGMRIDFSRVNTFLSCFFHNFVLDNQYQVSVAMLDKEEELEIMDCSGKYPFCGEQYDK